MSALKEIAVAALRSDGWTLKKSPDHHGLAMTYLATKGDEEKLITIRTTETGDEGVSFVPYIIGDELRWKSLFDNDHRPSPNEIAVISANDPSVVHTFDGNVVRKMYMEEYDRRVTNGRQPQLGRGFWIPLRDFPTHLAKLPAQAIDDAQGNTDGLATIVERARQMVATAAGVEIESVRISVEW